MAAAVGHRRHRRRWPAAERRAAVPCRRVDAGAHARQRRQRRRWGHGPQPAAAAATGGATTRRSRGNGGRDGGGSWGRGVGGGADGAVPRSKRRRSSSPVRQWRGRGVRGRLSGRGRRQRCRRVGAGGDGGTSDHAISGVTGGAAAGGAGRRAPRSVQVTWRRTGATVVTAGTPTRTRAGVGGSGRLVGAAADRAPAVLVAGGRAPTRARGVCRACAAAVVVTPTGQWGLDRVPWSIVINSGYLYRLFHLRSKSESLDSHMYVSGWLLCCHEPKY